MKKYIYLAGLFAMMLLGCDKGASIDPSGTSNETGKGGSMARFAIYKNYLYTVDNYSLKVYDISLPQNPVWVNTTDMGTGIETIFPKDSLLFIGTQFGMRIYSLSNPSNPAMMSTYSHIYSCDPVIADNKYAYVTLYAENLRCRRTTNELQIVDISSLLNPVFLTSYPMTSPRGLGKDGNLLFVCDDGLKVYNATHVNDLKLIKHFKISAFDVIPNNNYLMVIGDDGLYQYHYVNDSIYQQSKIAFE